MPMNSYALRRRLFAAATWSLTAVLLASTMMPAITLANPDKKPAKKPVAEITADQKIVHVLNRLGYGPRPGDVERVKQMGLDKYLDLQLHPDRISDKVLDEKLAGMTTLNLSQGELIAIERDARELRRKVLKEAKTGEDGKADPSTLKPELRKELREQYAGKTLPRNVIQELVQAKVVRTVYSERQLQEVLTDFWFNHFNVFVGKGLDRVLLTSYERDVIRPHVFSKFEDLLKATAESPAMMFYLDNWQSVDPNARPPFPNARAGNANRRNPNQDGGVMIPYGRNASRQIERQAEREQRRQERDQQRQTAQNNPNLPGAKGQPKRKLGINENYARELMELHTLSVNGGYTQKDVTEVARCFTGWSIRRPYGGMLGGSHEDNGMFVYNDWAHDKGEKTVLGVKIPGGGGQSDGETVLHLLAHSPLTARFVATKLARRFVSDNPPQDMVDAAAETFLKTDGDLREVMRTILKSPEFFAKDNYRAKVKTPLELVASSLRATNADLQNAMSTARVLERLGMPLYGWQPPTGYPDTADHWVNTGALLGRLNFGLALVGNKLPGVNVQLDQLTGGETRPTVALDRLFKLFLQNEVSDQTRKSLKEQSAKLAETPPAPVRPAVSSAPAAAYTSGQDDMAMSGPDKDNSKQGRKERPPRDPGADNLADLARSGQPLSEVAQLTGLILGSPEFQRK